MKHTPIPFQPSPESSKKKTSFRLFSLLSLVLLFAISVLCLFSPLYHKAQKSLSLSTVLATPAQGGLLPNAETSLLVPTQITKIGDDYFLVDCYHNQILTSPSPDVALTDWLVLTDQIDRGHTIAGDGIVYLADDTENNRVLIFEKKDGHFYQTQVFDQIGVRPHYTVYDEATNRFYVLSSMTGELYVFYRQPTDNRIALEKILSVPDLNGYYVRSFTIDGSDVYFVSGNRAILRARLSDLQIQESWPIPDSIAGMIQLTRIQDYFYITVSTDLYGDQNYATILRTTDLSNLAEGNWEDIYPRFIGGGTPYYLSAFDGHYYLTEHRLPGHAVWEFDIEDNEPQNIKSLY